MFNNVQEEAVARNVEKLFSNPEAMAVILDYLQRLQSGFFKQDYRDAIFQKWDRFPVDIYDAYAFSAVHASIGRGEIVMAKIHVGACPCSDDEIEKMNKLLSNLPKPFSAEFWGLTCDSDGKVIASESFGMDVITCENQRVVATSDGVFPLEVGTTSAAKTMTYLQKWPGKLARWPYDSEYIWLFQRLTDFAEISYGKDD
jgi:hypothetical protein